MSKRSRKLPSLQAIYERASEPWSTCLHPDNCGDGWNSYDCVVCMAKARKRFIDKRDKARREREVKGDNQ